MKYLACDDVPDPITMDCPSGWVVVESISLPPMNPADAMLVAGAIIVCWATVFGVVIVYRMIAYN